MQTDTLIVLGLSAIITSFFPLLNGFSRGEMPRAWAVLAIAGFALMATIMANNPNTYDFASLPAVVGRVVSGFL
jgi:hypothetical protein